MQTMNRIQNTARVAGVAASVPRRRESLRLSPAQKIRLAAILGRQKKK
jgi:hypothetical protein